MKVIVFVISLILLDLYCFSQDVIYFKDKSTQKAKILEVNIEKVRFKKSEIPNGPTYEALKIDIIKVKYSNGFVDYFVPIADSVVNKHIEKPIQFDTSRSSNIYILFHYGNDESRVFPIYFNDQYICTIKNHSRLQYIIHSTGRLVVERRGQDAYQLGPRTELFIEPGANYGISIKEPYPWTNR